MAAIPVKHTEVDSSSAWDNSQVAAETEAELRYVHAWVDSDADPELMGSYKLPHHYTDGGPAILAGVNNAKARLSQTDIPQADVAGVTAHLNAHQKDAKQGIVKTIQAFLEDLKGWLIGDNPDEPIEQAISMPDIYVAVSEALNVGQDEDGAPSYMRLIDCYVNEAEIYAVVAIEGKIFKCPVTIVPGGVSLGEMAQVEIAHNPVGQAFKVMQQANGQYRWFAFPAATAVLNRNGYLNSRELYDNFIQHINDGAPMPFLTFYHIGEPLVLGQADFVEREEYTLLISGTFNDSPLAHRLAQSTEWGGVSIGYYVAPEAIRELRIDETVKIPVHTDGVLKEVSAMQEIDAACLMTVFTSKGVTQMNKNTLKKLEQLAGVDPAALEVVKTLADTIDKTTQIIENENLVRQEQVVEPPVSQPEIVPVPIAPVNEIVEPEAPVAPEQNYTLTDEAVQAIAERVRSGFADMVSSVQQSIEVVRDEYKSFRETTLPEIVAGLQSRLDALEQTDQTKVAQVVADMPRNTIVVGYRPSQQNSSTTPILEDPAAESLARLRAEMKKK